MSAENPNEGQDHAFERAINALRDVPVPDGPPREVLEKTLSAVRAVDARRRPANATILKIAIAASLALIVFLFVWNSPPRRNQVAFADVLQAIAKVKSVKYKVTSRFLTPVKDSREYVGEFLIDDQGRMRITEGDKTIIYDTKRHTSLTLNASEKQAKVSGSAGVWEFHTRPDGAGGVITETTDMAGPQTILQRMQALPPTAMPLGRKQIDGQTVEGFAVAQNGATWRLWTDVETHLPRRVEEEAPATGQTPAIETVFSEIAWNCPVDELQMSMVPPPDYKVAQPQPQLQWTPRWDQNAGWSPSSQQSPVLQRFGVGTLTLTPGK